MKWLLVSASLVLAGCAVDVSKREAHALVAHGAVLLDVRTAEEYAEKHVDGAVNIPVNELEKRLGELPRDRQIVVYCHTGARAGVATIILRKHGRNAHNAGAMSHWTTERAEFPE